MMDAENADRSFESSTGYGISGSYSGASTGHTSQSDYNAGGGYQGDPSIGGTSGAGSAGAGYSGDGRDGGGFDPSSGSYSGVSTDVYGNITYSGAVGTGVYGSTSTNTSYSYSGVQVDKYGNISYSGAVTGNYGSSGNYGGEASTNNPGNPSAGGYAGDFTGVSVGSGLVGGNTTTGAISYAAPTTFGLFAKTSTGIAAPAKEQFAAVIGIIDRYAKANAIQVTIPSLHKEYLESQLGMKLDPKTQVAMAYSIAIYGPKNEIVAIQTEINRATNATTNGNFAGVYNGQNLALGFPNVALACSNCGLESKTSIMSHEITGHGAASVISEVIGKFGPENSIEKEVLGAAQALDRLSLDSRLGYYSASREAYAARQEVNPVATLTESIVAQGLAKEDAVSLAVSTLSNPAFDRLDNALNAVAESWGFK